jgi:hypothetical protein
LKAYLACRLCIMWTISMPDKTIAARSTPVLRTLQALGRAARNWARPDLPSLRRCGRLYKKESNINEPRRRGEGSLSACSSSIMSGWHGTCSSVPATRGVRAAALGSPGAIEAASQHSGE